MGIFFSVLATVFLSEMGDKTQFFIIAMSSKYKLRDVAIGTVGAILLLNLLAIAAGSTVSALVRPDVMKFIAAAAFFVFAYTSFFFSENEDEKADTVMNKKIGAALTVGILFFAAEFGDKSQLSALNFSLSYGVEKAIVVFFACSLGLIFADALALVLSYFLGKRIPEKIMTLASGAFFAVFGGVTLNEAISLVMVNDRARSFVYTLGVCALFVVACLVTAIIKLHCKPRRENKEELSKTIDK